MHSLCTWPDSGKTWLVYIFSDIVFYHWDFQRCVKQQGLFVATSCSYLFLILPKSNSYLQTHMEKDHYHFLCSCIYRKQPFSLIIETHIKWSTVACKFSWTSSSLEQCLENHSMNFSYEKYSQQHLLVKALLDNSNWTFIF